MIWTWTDSEIVGAATERHPMAENRAARTKEGKQETLGHRAVSELDRSKEEYLATVKRFYKITNERNILIPWCPYILRKDLLPTVSARRALGKRYGEDASGVKESPKSMAYKVD